MNAKEYVISWLKQMTAQFTWITFKYEYSQIKHAHCVEVYPKHLVETSDDYCEQENIFSAEFENKFDDTVLFSTEDELFKCSGNAQVYKYSDVNAATCNVFTVNIGSSNFIFTDDFYTESGQTEPNKEFAGENNYALAA